MSGPRTAGEGVPRPLRIGAVTIDPPLVLGPMAGTTKRAYRLLCRRGGAGLVSGEMVSINGIAHGNERSFEMLRTFDGEHPVSLQLFGSSPELMPEAVAAAEEAGADVIDINMGCSVAKVRRSGAGVALMAEPEGAAALTSAAAGTATVPVTVKLRAGLTAGDEGYIELAQRLQDAGAAAVVIHARAASQGFGGPADWTHISRLVEALEVPVIGNGDVTEPEDARRMMRETGCAAVMVARAAWGRPWVFGRMAAALRGEAVPSEPDAAGRLGVALLHAQMLARDVGERIAMHQMRAHMHQYVRGLANARGFRSRANDVSTLDGLRRLIERYLAELRSTEDEPISHAASETQAKTP